MRRSLRAKRRALSSREQKLAARRLCRLLLCQPLFIRSRHIAFYLPNDGEIDPRPLIVAAQRLGKHCYLPVLAPGNVNRLWFVRYTDSTPMVKNRYGISEPRPDFRRRRRAQDLDLVLLPLVGFDRFGGRMGMGGGFYDRSFSFKQHVNAHKPYLIGLAHGCQQVDRLKLASWDIPLGAVATDGDLFHPPGSFTQREFLK
ncbi:5-formyltetrahydrofolate cyclo-ligase [Pseudomaricurvus alkylphenolicus]|uniref:5-formyltetrahydrofolate cyclo-ligase n=1 Tax=Pseudomaricurvus alkylphenolicus TaxID=1306991 RepID=UPI001981C16D|nr:5-formyltetrahydrofolate cyclo-ligase [Pseudomaricurvus alkylphenolicus]